MIPGLPARLERDMRRMYLDQILQVRFIPSPIQTAAGAFSSIVAHYAASMTAGRMFTISARNGDANTQLQQTSASGLCRAGRRA